MTQVAPIDVQPYHILHTPLQLYQHLHLPLLQQHQGTQLELSFCNAAICMIAHIHFIAEECFLHMNLGPGFAVQAGGTMKLSACSSSCDFVEVSAQGTGMF